jgi:hypothetical protein
MKREKTGIAVLILVGLVAITLAMLEAFAGEPVVSAPATAGDVADIESQGRG